MIDLCSEEVVTLSAATRHLPARRAGKRPHVATMYRWASRGLRGQKLETIRIGGTLCTSLQALQRFFDKLSGSVDEYPDCPSRNSGRRAETAERRLNELNF